MTAVTDHDVLKQTGDYRVRVMQDGDRNEPDGDGQGYVLRVWWDYSDRPVVKVAHKDYNDPEPDFDVSQAYRRFGVNHELVGRYLRMFHDVVSFDYVGSVHGPDLLLFAVTRRQAESWATPAERYAELAKQASATWRQWIEGDVYGYVVEKLERWGRLESDGDGWRLADDRRETWEHTDSLWGLYGREYAEEEALDALGSYTADEEHPDA